MAGPESKFYDELKSPLSEYFLQRVENTVDLGTPDVFFARRAVIPGWPQGWIELKVMTLPLRKTTRITIPFRPGQYGWLRKATKAGVLALLLIKSNHGVHAFRGEDIQLQYTNDEFWKLGNHFNTSTGSHGETSWSYQLKAYLSDIES